MEVKKGQLCRLCLDTICAENCQEISEVNEILKVLLLNLNLDISRERAICETCSERLQKSFDFKSMCLNTYDKIFPLINNEDKAELDLKVIYAKRNIEAVKIPKEKHVCRLCMELINDQLFHSVKCGEYMLEKYMPELDNKFKNFVLCASCADSLKEYSCFIEQCLVTEDKIKKYCDVKTTIKRGQLSLEAVVQFKVEDTFTDMEKISVKTEVKDENQYFEEPEKIFLKSDFDKNVIKTEPVELMDVQKTEPEEYETCVNKREVPRNPTRVKFKTEKPTFICAICGYQNDIRKTFVRHMFFHRNIPTRKFQCHLCEYKAKRKVHLDSHLKTHEKPPIEKKTFKCDFCPYQVKFQCMLKPHMLIHMDPEQVKVYSCKLCPYKSKYKAGVTQHMRKHDANKVLQCEKCDFKTNYEESMKRHQVFHLDPALRRKFKCATCEFEAERKCTLYRHIMRTHTDPSAVPMHKCDQCKFQSFYKGEYNQHMLKHKDPSELPTYNCEHCDFKTIFKKALTRHQYHHKDQSEVKMYKCDKCPYVTNARRYLVALHKVKHLDPSETVMLKCDQCEFSSKYKSNLTAHIRKTHK